MPSGSPVVHRHSRHLLCKDTGRKGGKEVTQGKESGIYPKPACYSFPKEQHSTTAKISEIIVISPTGQLRQISLMSILKPHQSSSGSSEFSGIHVGHVRMAKTPMLHEHCDIRVRIAQMSHCWTWSLRLSRRKYLSQDCHGEHGLQSVCYTAHSLLLGEFRTEILGLPAVETQPLAPRTVRHCPKEVAELWCSSSVQLPTLPRLSKEHRVPLPWVQSWDPRTGSSKQQRTQQFNSLTGSAAGTGKGKILWTESQSQADNSILYNKSINLSAIFMSGMETVHQPSLVGHTLS